MRKLKVGLLISQTGPTGIWGPSAINSAVLAAAEYNSRGDSLDREVEIVVGDAGWEPAQSASTVQRMVDEDEVSAVVGMMASVSRGTVARKLRGKVPFIYTPNFERVAPEPIIALGATDDLLLPRLLAWVDCTFGARRFAIIGSDYCWAHKTMPMTARMIAGAGGTVTSILARPIDAPDDWDDRAVQRIRAEAPDVILMFLTGAEAIPFNRAFHREGLSRLIPRCAVGTDETVLQALEPEEGEALFACANYFASIRTNANRAFMERYWTVFGDRAPIPNFYGQSCYEGVNVALALMRAARSADPVDLLRMRPEAVHYRSARADDGKAEMGSAQPVYIAAAQDRSFGVVARYT